MRKPTIDRQRGQVVNAWARRRAILGALLAAAVMAGTAGSAVAQSSGSATGWTYEFTPYLWTSGLKGEVKSGDLPKTQVDQSFSDVLSALDFGIMGAFEARNGRWGLMFDGIYMKVSTAGTASKEGAGPGGAALTVNADVEVQQTGLSAGVAYRLTQGPTAVDVIGGVRYTSLRPDVVFDASLVGLTGTTRRTATKDWYDGYVGVRVMQPIAENWTLVGYVDIGGLDAGSKVNVQALAGVNYQFSKTIVAKFGYRYMGVDYDKDGFLYDMKSQGLYLGTGIRF